MTRDLLLGLLLSVLFTPASSSYAEESLLKQIPLADSSKFPRQFQRAIKSTSQALAKRNRNPSDYYVSITRGGSHFNGPGIYSINCKHKDHLTPEMQKWIREHISLGDPCGKCFEIEYSTKQSKILSIYQSE
jgi:hypothetical protein